MSGDRGVIEFKKMDDEDFVFVNKPLTAKEDKAFSDFLKKRKSKVSSKQNTISTLGRNRANA